MLVPGKKSSKVINAHIILTLICIFSLQCLFLNLSIAKANAVNEEYAIKPGDEISINIKGYEDYSKTVIVGQDGKVIYLSNKKVQAEGLTLLQFGKQIEYMLQPYISSPQVDISMKRTEVIIKPGDIINIIVKDNENYNQTVTVQPNGKIQYLKFGDIQVAGLTASQIKTQIENILRGQLFAPEVTISTKPEDYVIKPGDTVNITVAGNQKYDQISTVQQDGQISHLLLGIMKASGKTASMLQTEITEKLKPSIAEPKVLVSVQQGIESAEVVKTEERIPCQFWRHS
jgi:protein involved in polysaccharide export with SLBB domain